MEDHEEESGNVSLLSFNCLLRQQVAIPHISVYINPWVGVYDNGKGQYPDRREEDELFPAF